MKLALIVPVFIMSFSVLSASAQEIGLQLYSLNSQLQADAAGTMARVKEMGIREVEMKGTHGMSFPEFIKLLAVNGISVISFEADFEKIVKFPQVVADEARSYGAKYVVCSGKTFESKEDMERAILALNHAGKVIGRNGLLLCYQPQYADFMKQNEGSSLDHLVEKLDSRFVHFEMDVLAVKRGGEDPVSLLKKHPTRFVLLQLKDAKAGLIASNATPTTVTLGTGEVGIKGVLETARELGIRHLFIEDESSKAEKQIAKSLAYLRTLNDKDSAKK